MFPSGPCRVYQPNATGYMAEFGIPHPGEWILTTAPGPTPSQLTITLNPSPTVPPSNPITLTFTGETRNVLRAYSSDMWELSLSVVSPNSPRNMDGLVCLATLSLSHRGLIIGLYHVV